MVIIHDFYTLIPDKQTVTVKTRSEYLKIHKDINIVVIDHGSHGDVDDQQDGKLEKNSGVRNYLKVDNYDDEVDDVDDDDDIVETMNLHKLLDMDYRKHGD